MLFQGSGFSGEVNRRSNSLTAREEEGKPERHSSEVPINLMV